MQEPIDITPSDQNFIYEQLAPLGGLFGEEVTCQCPIYSTEEDKDRELSQSILVIGKYRVLLIKKEKNTRKVKKSIHLYDLIEISEPEINASFFGEPNTIEIKYKDNSPSNKDSGNNSNIKSFLIKSPNKEIEIIIIKTLALTSFSISKGFPENYLLKIKLPTTRYPHLKFDHEIGIQDGKGIAEQYIAHSHYFNTKSTLDYLRHLETLYLTRYPELDFSEIPGIDPTCSLNFNLYTSIITLRHNNFIRSLKLSSLPHVNITAAVGEMMLTNTTITELTLSNLLTEQSFAPIGNFLKYNPYTSLQVLNLSNNIMAYDSVVSLCDGLAHFNHSLVTLNLASCQIPSKGIALLFDSLQKNFAMSLTLEVLVLSDNRFQDAGSKAFASWLSKIKGENSLRKLILSNTQLNISVIAPPLRTLSLESLDLSKNSMSISTARSLAVDALESIPSLKYLNLSNCGLVGDSVQTILVALANNKNSIKNLTVNFQSNGFANKTYLALISVLPSCKGFLRGLDLSFNSFNSKQLQDIVHCLLGSNLESLDIGNNYMDEALANKLIELVKENGIQKLGFGHLNKPLGSSLHELIAALGTCKSIQVLDLMGNGLDDQGACILADCIRHSKSLKRVYIAGNKFTAVGWQSISSPLLYYRNTSLVHIDLPLMTDVILVSDSNPTPLTPVKRELLQMTITKIRNQLSLNKNKVPSSSRFAYLPQTDPPLYVKPVANVPEYLSQYVLSPVEQKLLEKVNLNSNNNTSNGSIKINLNVQSGTSSIGSSSSNGGSLRPSLSSIFTKPINLINDIRSGELTLGGNSSANNSRLNSPVHFGDDDWKGNRNDDDRQENK
ncbi:hypothetical protein DICPUDRAFT_93591 [Dictyostelium purpureum]|uniref:Uncharacterized protein n=1 Tax=Dictyostelium purpureum TaxID=5786 RepID=F0Z9D8_DICPU|nr:uncharacterized protein DICPUDRAFT_93591 [Dictyostelium purpureum]EGC39457.1 hypothetical protein DICPUDRAFT_93591 [Dictyostelium purpureum]|eukprot:XP_003284015.1 hypothetical protein DICPUDRAFT_93591 [Dictyostelium purpureum]